METAVGGGTPGKGRGYWNDFARHVVCQGDTVGSIATYYRITREELMKRNGMQTTSLWIGHELIIARWVEV